MRTRVPRLRDLRDVARRRQESLFARGARRSSSRCAEELGLPWSRGEPACGDERPASACRPRAPSKPSCSAKRRCPRAAAPWRPSARPAAVVERGSVALGDDREEGSASCRAAHARRVHRTSPPRASRNADETKNEKLLRETIAQLREIAFLPARERARSPRKGTARADVFPCPPELGSIGVWPVLARCVILTYM